MRMGARLRTRLQRPIGFIEPSIDRIALWTKESDLSSFEDRRDVLHGVPPRVPIPDCSEQAQINTEVTESLPQKTFRWKANFHLGRGPGGLISKCSLSGIGRKFPELLSLPDSEHQDANKNRSVIPVPLQQLWCSGGKSFTPLLTWRPNLGWNKYPKILWEGRGYLNDVFGNGSDLIGWGGRGKEHIPGTYLKGIEISVCVFPAQQFSAFSETSEIGIYS